MRLQWLVMVLCGFVMLAFADEGGEDELSESDRHYAAIYRMPSWIKQVRSVCPWQSKSDDLLQGHVRLTHGVFAEHDMLYLQWLKKEPKNHFDEAVATRTVEELSQVKLRITDVRQQLESNHCKLIAHAKSLDDSFTYRLEIQLTEPGHYQYLQIKELAVDRR